MYDLENNFTYHAPHGDQAERYERLRKAGKEMAEELAVYIPEGRTAVHAKAEEFSALINELTPMSREQDEAFRNLDLAAGGAKLAMKHLETAVMWANAAIARNEGCTISDSDV